MQTGVGADYIVLTNLSPRERPPRGDNEYVWLLAIGRFGVAYSVVHGGPTWLATTKSRIRVPPPPLSD